MRASVWYLCIMIFIATCTFHKTEQQCPTTELDNTSKWEDRKAMDMFAQESKSELFLIVTKTFLNLHLFNFILTLMERWMACNVAEKKKPLKMTAAQVIEMPVTNKRSFQNYKSSHLHDHTSIRNTINITMVRSYLLH